MDSIVKLLLALIILYCFVKLFCGCSVEGISEKKKEEGKQLLGELEAEIEEEAEELLNVIQEKYNPTPTPTPASNNAQLGSIFTGCGKGEHLSDNYNPFDWSCEECPIGTYSDEPYGRSKECKSCPNGGLPITNDGREGVTGSTGCRYCGYVALKLYENKTVEVPSTSSPWGERYSDGIRCRNCPDNSSINRGVYDITIPGSAGMKFHGGRNINDCICDEGYIKVTNEGGGWKCEKIE